LGIVGTENPRFVEEGMLLKLLGCWGKLGGGRIEPGNGDELLGFRGGTVTKGCCELGVITGKVLGNWR